MQRFKTDLKKCSEFFKKEFSRCRTVFSKLCKKVIPSVSLSIVGFFKRSPRALAAVVTVAFVLSCAVTVVFATGTTTAYSVVYEGKTIATVKSPEVLAEAEIFAANKLNNPNCTSCLIKTSLTQTIVAEKNLMSSSELAESIISHSEDIIKANVLKVGDEAVATGSSNGDINSSITEYISDYKRITNSENIECISDYQVTELYALKSEIASLPLIDEYLASDENPLSLQAVTTVVVEEEIPFEVVKTKSDALALGTEKITQTGVVGKKEVTYKVYSLDGVETKRVAHSEKILLNPVEQRVEVGTKRAPSSAEKSVNASMSWPVKRVAGSYVSSYMGDGRGHKGMDIVAPSGTPIYAAAGGTVTFAGWDSSGYGYKIIVKHSNGYETLYAHCSALFVNKGDVVAEGENIASVGSTGRSTGSHLHFEVRQNGCIKNPSNYIGRN